MSPRPDAPPSHEPASAPAGAGFIMSTALACACVVAAALLHTAPTEATPLRASDQPSLFARYADGAPAGFSGGFAEDSCHACHFHADVNSGPGQVAIAGVPDRFVAGERYSLTVTLTRPGMAIAGYQLTARLKDGGAQAGTLAPAPGEEDRTAIAVQGGIQYAGQRRGGTALTAPDTARWTVHWTAPAASGTVVVHVAANAADRDESAQGDYIHTAVVQSDPASAGAPLSSSRIVIFPAHRAAHQVISCQRSSHPSTLHTM